MWEKQPTSTMVGDTICSVLNAASLHAVLSCMTATRRSELILYWAERVLISSRAISFHEQLKVNKPWLYGKGVINERDNNCHCLS